MNRAPDDASFTSISPPRNCEARPGSRGAGEGHAHAHPGHSPAHRESDRAGDRRRLLATLALTVSMLFAEAVGGWLSGSLALLSDAGHMLTDAAALVLAAAALWFSSRPADLKRTYGFFRLEVLAALINGLTLIGISVYIAYEAYQRIAHPRSIDAPLMLAVATAGLLVNVVGMKLLSHSHNLNVRGAFFHLVGDALSSLGVIVAGVITWATGSSVADPIVSVLIACIIAVSAVRLVRQAIHVLLEGVPEHIDLVEVFGAIRAVPGVAAVHDLHIWTIAHGHHALSAHLVLDGPHRDRDEVLNAARSMLLQRFALDHTTLQLESAQFAQRSEQ